MKRLFLITMLLLLGICANAQTEKVTTKSSTQVKDKLVSYQMGTVTTTNGAYTILFEPALDAEYTIMLTPYSEDAVLYIAEKKSDKAVIKAKKGSDVTFDYVVFIKRPMPAPPADK